MTYWTSPRGILQRARDHANPYKTTAARQAFQQGWADGADDEDMPTGTNAYARGWAARVAYERSLVS